MLSIAISIVRNINLWLCASETKWVNLISEQLVISYILED